MGWVFDIFPLLNQGYQRSSMQKQNVTNKKYMHFHTHISLFEIFFQRPLMSMRLAEIICNPSAKHWNTQQGFSFLPTMIRYTNVFISLIICNTKPVGNLPDDKLESSRSKLWTFSRNRNRFRTGIWSQKVLEKSTNRCNSRIAADSCD